MPKLKFNVTPENVNNWLPEGFKLVVRHGHQGNTPPEMRTLPSGKVSPYVTVAVVYRVEQISDDEKAYTPITAGAAMCSPKDNPIRRRAWLMAAGRAVKAMYTDRSLVEETLGVTLPAS